MGALSLPVPEGDTSAPVKHSTTPRQHQLASVGGIAVAIAIWIVLAFVVDNPTMLPQPWKVALRLWRDFHSPLFWNAAGATALESIVGALLGLGFALPLAFCIYKSPLLDAAFGPLVSFTQAIPSVALAPLLVIWIGYGLLPISILCALIVFFPILTTSTLGLKSLPKEVIEAARLDGATGWNLLRNIEAPMSLPSFLTGLRTGFTLSIIGAVVGEFVMGGHGLGERLALQSTAADMTGLFATVTVLCVWAALVAYAITLVERHSHTMNALIDER